MMLKEVHSVYSPTGFHWVGDGFKSNNYDIPGDVSSQLMDPYLMVGFAPPHEYTATGRQRGVGAHPHAGFETVTLVYEGELAHADSAGNRGILPEGGVQWMTAGRGIMHEEFHSKEFSEAGGTLSMSQLWVNLPAAHKKVEPAYQDLSPDDIPSVSVGASSTARLVTGTIGDTKGPATTYTPMLMVDIHVSQGDSIELPVPEGFNAVALVVQGNPVVGGRATSTEDLVVFHRQGTALQITSDSDARVVVFAGEPIGEPVVHYGPFVASSREDLMSIFADYESGKMGSVQ